MIENIVLLFIKRTFALSLQKTRAGKSNILCNVTRWEVKILIVFGMISEQYVLTNINFKLLSSFAPDFRLIPSYGRALTQMAKFIYEFVIGPRHSFIYNIASI